MNNAPYDHERPNVALITALSSRYTLDELYTAQREQTSLTCYYYPSGKSGKAKVWKGIPDSLTIQTLRRLVGVARGKSYVYDSDIQGPPTWLNELDCKADREIQRAESALIGQQRDGFDRIKTFKWTTDGTTHKKIPPNTLAWRDLYSGKVYITHPSDDAVAL